MNLGKLGFAIKHKIIIKPTANMGFIVKVGCGEFVAENDVSLLAQLTEYLRHPADLEEEYNKLPGRGGDIAGVPRPEPPLQEPDRNPETATEARG